MPVHRHSRDFPPILATAEEIRAAAHAYEAEHHDYAESGPLIESGEPFVKVVGDSLGAFGREVRIWVCPMIRITEGPHKGGTIGTGDPQVLIVRRFDGRLSPVDIGKRLLKKHLAAVRVPIEYKRG